MRNQRVSGSVGWIVINKSNGEWDFVEAPLEQSEDRKAYLEDANRRVEAITNDAPFKIPFQSTPEMHTVDGQKVETGNRLMPKTCTFCSFKTMCWKNAVHAPKATSKAKFKPVHLVHQARKGCCLAMPILYTRGYPLELFDLNPEMRCVFVESREARGWSCNCRFAGWRHPCPSLCVITSQQGEPWLGRVRFGISNS